MSKLPSVFLDVYSGPYQRHYARHDLFKSTKDSLDFVQRLTLVKKLPVHGGCVNTISWNDTGEYILSGSDDQHLCITNGSTYKLVTSLRTRHPANIFSAKFLPNTGDKKIISCSGDGMILYTNLDRTEDSFKHCFNCHVGTVYKIVTVPNDSNTFLSCGEDGTVRWFDLRIKTQCTLEECKEDILINCRRPVTALAVNPMFPYQLAIGCYDSSVRIYDRRMLGTQATGNFTGQSYQGLMTKFTVPEFRGKSHRITSLVYSSDSNEILVSYSTEYLYLFRIKGNEDRQSSLFTAAHGDPRYRKGGTSTPPMKRLRLRGDWSDTGPNARPERELRGGNQPRSSHANLMQHVSDVLTRMLNDSARRNRSTAGRGRSPARTSQEGGQVPDFGNAGDNSDFAPGVSVTCNNEVSSSEESTNPETSHCFNCGNPTTSSRPTFLRKVPCTDGAVVPNDDLVTGAGKDAGNHGATSSCLTVLPSSSSSDDGQNASENNVRNKDAAGSSSLLVRARTPDGTSSQSSADGHRREEDTNETGAELRSQGVHLGESSFATLLSQDLDRTPTEPSLPSLEESTAMVVCEEEKSPSANEGECSNSIAMTGTADVAPLVNNSNEASDSRGSSRDGDATRTDGNIETRARRNRAVPRALPSSSYADEGNDDSDDASSDTEMPSQDSLSNDQQERSRSSSPFDILTCMNKAFKKQKEEYDKEEKFVQHLPQPILLHKYTGHRNARTMIKEANFWGDDYVMSGSDCGHVFIWNRHTTELVMIMEADHHVVNCLQPHPYDPVLATSGIDYDIKLWAPQSEESYFDKKLAMEIMGRNEIMLEETRDTITVPASFMIRMLASFNHLRQGGILARWRQSARSNHVASDDE